MKQNEKTRIVGQKCDLVPYMECHVETYHNWMENEEIRRLTGSERLNLKEEYEMQRSWREDDDKLTFIVLEKDGNNEESRMLGDVNLFISEDVAEVEVMIAEERGRKRGIGLEAVSLIIAYAFMNLGLRKFCAKITDDNIPSLKMFEEKLGFLRISHSSAFKEHTLELPEEKIDNFVKFFEQNARLTDYKYECK